MYANWKQSLKNILKKIICRAKSGPWPEGSPLGTPDLSSLKMGFWVNVLKDSSETNG